jgi:hypothetical protein
MAFEGAVEAVSREVISGWASYVVGEKRTFPDVRLQFKTFGSFAPTRTIDRGERTGFVFRLPPELQAVAWPDFLDDFDAVIAQSPQHPESGQWRAPLYKSVLSGLNPDNRTGLLAALLREYSVIPKTNGRIAALTIAYNERLMLPLWAKYYGAKFGPENLYVIDQGSDLPYDDLLPKGVSIIRLPRDMFDNWLIARLVAVTQRLLLESYDSVLYSDSDEFVCADPNIIGSHSLCDFLRSLSEPIGITTGYDLLHDIASEAAYDRDRPVLSQRRVMRRQPSMDKPLISRLPLNWVPGFHTAAEGGSPIAGLYLVHSRWFDLDQALIKGGFYRSSSWNQFDVEHKLAA